MKKLISLALSVLMILSVTAVAYAAPSADDISYSVKMGTDDEGYATQTIVVEGDAVAEAADKFVTLRIWKSGMGVADYDEDPSARVDDIDLFAVLLQTRADSEGNFTFEFPFNEVSADYTANVKVQGEEIVTITISTADIEAANEFIDKINDADELADMTTADFDDMLANPADFGLNLTVFNNLTPASKNKVLEDIIDDLTSNNENGGSNSIETVVDAIAEKTLIEIFKQTDDADMLSEAFDVYDDLLDIENLENASGIYPLYDDFGDDQDDVFESMGKTSYDDIEDLLEGFKEAVFIKAISDTQYYTELGPVIENNFDYLDLDSDDQDEYEDNEAVKKYVLKEINKVKSSIGTVDKFRDAFSDAVSNYGKDDDKKGGGGSGGGTGSSVSVGTDLIPTTVAKPVTAAYNDISGHWAQTAITHLSTARILNGRGDGVFDPDGSVTRAEYVKMIVEAFGLYNEDAVAEFNDIAENAWYYKYVASMVDRGYILGDDNGNFNPNALIKRQDMAVILHRVLQGLNKLPVIPTIEKMFTDFDSTSSYAQNSVAYMSNMKLVNGANGVFRPHDSSTRAEAAQIIYNAITEVGNK